MKRLLLLTIILIFVGGCISNPRIKGVSAGAMFLDVDLGYAGKIRQVIPIVLVNIEGD